MTLTRMQDTAEPVYRIPCVEIARVATSPGDPLQIVLTLHNATTYNIRFGLREHAADWARLVGTCSRTPTPGRPSPRPFRALSPSSPRPLPVLSVRARAHPHPPRMPNRSQHPASRSLKKTK